MKLGLLLAIFFYLEYVGCDTPANCTYNDIQGEWEFLEGKRDASSSVDCKNFTGPVAHILKLKLEFPNIVVDDLGRKGYWTIVYNQGFEVVLNYRKYFAFSLYIQNAPGNVTSYCDKTLPGWSHDVLGKNWACYIGRKIGPSNPPKVSITKSSVAGNFLDVSLLFDQVNKAKKLWTAYKYPELFTMSVEDMIKRAGGRKSKIINAPHPWPMSYDVKSEISKLPVEFDWRNVNGINYVGPVRNQGKCGSCYAFSSLAMLESRLRIMTNNTLKVELSPQDVVSCSEYSQGCEGGYPYVIAGKYAQDFGILSEKCYPYEGRDDSCSWKKCKRFYVAKYKYVGDFFGGCNEELMRLELVQNGPLTVAFEVYPDFQLYKSGIYHHVPTATKFNPFSLVNHGVLITGYGIDNQSGEKYWTVKNSWGTNWGEEGYFKIRRGTNECNIESMAVSAIPIP